jgi:predicted CopG family antitoxin
MGHKAMSLEDSAYAKPRTVKTPRESFSEVVLRLLDEEEPPSWTSEIYSTKRLLRDWRRWWTA